MSMPMPIPMSMSMPMSIAHVHVYAHAHAHAHVHAHVHCPCPCPCPLPMPMSMSMFLNIYVYQFFSFDVLISKELMNITTLRSNNKSTQQGHWAHATNMTRNADNGLGPTMQIKRCIIVYFTYPRFYSSSPSVCMPQISNHEYKIDNSF